MQWIYRGIPHETNHQLAQDPSVDSSYTENTTQPKVCLTYRGSTYEYQSPSTSSLEAWNTDAPEITLTYRGQTYQRRSQVPRAYHPPRTLNWRWQVQP